MLRSHQDLEAQRRSDFVWVEWVASLLDSKFKIGRFRFGLDPILNLIPYAGQFVAFSVSLMLVVVMFRNGVRTKVVIKMLLNVVADALLGAIPIFGYVFDFFNRANEKNIKLLREHYFDGKNRGSATGLVIALLALFTLVCILTFYIIWLLVSWSWDFLSGLF